MMLCVCSCIPCGVPCILGADPSMDRTSSPVEQVEPETRIPKRTNSIVHPRWDCRPKLFAVHSTPIENESGCRLRLVGGMRSRWPMVVLLFLSRQELLVMKYTRFGVESVHSAV